MEVVHFGLGPIGIQILDRSLRSDRLCVRGAVDREPGLVGRDVGTLSGRSEVGVPVVSTVGELPPDVGAAGGVTALHAAGSHLAQVWPQLRELLDGGFSVVSTCEELAFPWHRHPALSSEIDRFARARGRTVIGIGVNPGFVMDVLPLVASAVLGEVRSVRVSRAVDVSTRRVPLQRKVGVGLAPDAFERLAAAGDVGHVGLEESARLVAHGLRWQVADVANTIAPTVATRDHALAVGDVKAGEVDGLAQTCVITAVDGRTATLDLTMRAEVEQGDTVVVSGDEQLRLMVPGGVPGDGATAAIAVNTATRMETLAPGLLTMVDAGLPRGS